METPRKKIFKTEDLPDHFHQNLVNHTEKVEDEIFKLIDGLEVNTAIFSLVSAVARIVGATYANIDVIDETDIQNVSDDFAEAILATYRHVKSNQET